MIFEKAHIEVTVTDQYADCYVNNEICVIARVGDISVFMRIDKEEFLTCDEIDEISKEISNMMYKKMTRIMASSVILNKCLES